MWFFILLIAPIVGTFMFMENVFGGPPTPMLL